MSVTGSSTRDGGSALHQGHRDRSAALVSGTLGLFAPRLSHLAGLGLPRECESRAHFWSMPRLGPSSLADKRRGSGQ